MQVSPIQYHLPVPLAMGKVPKKKAAKLKPAMPLN